MRTPVLLFASLTASAMIAPRELVAQPSSLLVRTSPTIAVAPGLDVPNGSTWFASWVSCSSSDTKNCASFDPVAAGVFTAELVFPKVWNAIGSLSFGPSDGSVDLFLAATHHGGTSPNIFDDDAPPPPIHPATDDHSTEGPATGTPLLDHDDHAPVTATPEPTTLILAASGFGSLVGLVRRRRRLHGE